MDKRVRILLLLLFSQFLSATLTATGIFSTYLVNNGVNAPTTQSFVNYMLLWFVFSIVTIVRRKSLCPSIPLLYYLFIAIIDVEANYLVVKAYQYTSILSVQLLDCSTIVFALVLCIAILKHRFTVIHYCSCLVCLIGIVSLVVFDYLRLAQSEQGESTLLGDALCVAGSLGYATSNVLQECLLKEGCSPIMDTAGRGYRFVKRTLGCHKKSSICDNDSPEHPNTRLLTANANCKGVPFYEFLCYLGMFGSLISSLQLLIVERDEVHRLDAKETWPYFIGFSISLFCMYSLVPLLLMHSNAAFMNLSFLTSDFFALMASKFLFGGRPSVLYFVPFVVIICGLVLYNLNDQLCKLLKLSYPSLSPDCDVESPKIKPPTLN